MPHHGQEESMRQEEETQVPDVGSKPSLAPTTPSGNPVCCHFKASQESDHFPPAHNSHWDDKQDNLSPTLPWCLLPLALNLFFNTAARAFILQHKPKHVPSLLGNLQCLTRAYNELCHLCPNPWSPPCPFWPHLHRISHSLALLPPHWPCYSTHQICPTSALSHWLFPLPGELFTQRSAWLMASPLKSSFKCFPFHVVMLTTLLKIITPPPNVWFPLNPVNFFLIELVIFWQTAYFPYIWCLFSMFPPTSELHLAGIVNCFTPWTISSTQNGVRHIIDAQWIWIEQINENPRSISLNPNPLSLSPRPQHYY